MINVMEIGGHKAVVSFDPESSLFRGEFVELNGGADFYADSVQSLKEEGETSLKIFFDICREKGIAPTKPKSGKFVIRLKPEVHELAVIASKAQGISLNEWANRALQTAL